MGNISAAWILPIFEGNIITDFGPGIGGLIFGLGLKKKLYQSSRFAPHKHFHLFS
jgi:hypothetical protein